MHGPSGQELEGLYASLAESDMLKQIAELRGSIKALLDDNNQLNRRLLKLELAVSTLMPDKRIGQ
jgi:hypothetical protein